MTTIGRVTSTVWGGDPDLARKIGCGVSWNNTTNKLEVVAAAFNQMLLYLDDMHNAGEENIKAIFNIMNGEGRGRLKELQQSFSLSVFSTSNTSIVKIAKRLKLEDELEALIDRLPEISLPEGCPYFFEGIRTPDEFRVYGDGIRDLACKNFGWAGPEFLARFERHLEARRAFIEAFAKKRQDAYFRASKAITSARGRNLTRVGNKFATIYVSGCLARRFKILPFSEPELLEALLTCHRDHVEFIDRELGFVPTRAIAAPSAQGGAVATPTAIPGVLAPAERLFRRARKFVNDNRKGGFIDLRKPSADKPPPGGARKTLAKGAPVLGYIGEHADQKEYWIPGPIFRKMALGEERDLKRELYGRGLLETDRRGDDHVSYVVKRTLPNGMRPNFVVPARRADTPSLGYIGEHDGRREYWIPGPAFTGSPRGAAEDRALKAELFNRRPLVTDRRCVSWSRQRAGGASREMGCGNRANYLEPDLRRRARRS
jgi:hypothetical protein